MCSSIDGDGKADGVVDGRRQRKRGEERHGGFSNRKFDWNYLLENWNIEKCEENMKLKLSKNPIGTQMKIEKVQNDFFDREWILKILLNSKKD